MNKMVGFTLALAFALIVTLSPSVQARTLHYATPSPPIDGDPRTEALRWWADEIADRTDGSIKIKIHWLQSLITYQDAAKGVKAGIADISPMNPDYTKARMLLWTLSQTELGSGDPYVAAEAWTRTVKKFNKVFDRELQQMGLVNLTSISSGPRVLISSTRPYLVPADFKGDKVRLTPMSVQVAKDADWPVTSVNIEFADLYPALSRGTIDGAQSYLNLLLPYKQNEVVKHVVETGIGQSMIVTNMNRNAWESLSDHERKVMRDVSEEYRIRAGEAYVMDLKSARQEMENDKKHPVKVYKLDDEKTQVWADAYRPSVTKKMKELSKKKAKALEIHQYFMKTLDQVQKEVAEQGYPWERG